MKKKVQISEAWDSFLGEEFHKNYFVELLAQVNDAYASGEVYPPQEKIFRAFALCVPSDVRVVILGQDPYHTPGVADGLAFSSLPHNHIPPSLKNIYKEIEREFGVSCAEPPQVDEIRGVGKVAREAYSYMVTESQGTHNKEVRYLRRFQSSDLTHWARQGVLLLNTTLTVESGKANSHAEIGWHEFTDAVIGTVSRECPHVVFMLWGNYAKQKHVLIDSSKHLILKSPHPSPLSAHRGFLGNGHFKKANEYLRSHGKNEIRWC